MKIERICAYCGKPFLGTARAVYCTPSHRVLGNRAKKGEPLLPTWVSKQAQQESWQNEKIDKLKAVIAERDGEIARLQAEISGLYDKLTAAQQSTPKTEIVPPAEEEAQKKPPRLTKTQKRLNDLLEKKNNWHTNES